MRVSRQEYEQSDNSKHGILCSDHKKFVTKVIIGANLNCKYRAICDDCKCLNKFILIDEAISQYKLKQSQALERYKQLFQHPECIIKSFQNIKLGFDKSNVLSSSQQYFIDSLTKKLNNQVKQTFFEKQDYISKSQLEDFAPYLSFSQQEQQDWDKNKWVELKKLKNEFQQHYTMEFNNFIFKINEFQQQVKKFKTDVREVNRLHLQLNEENDQTYYQDLSSCQHLQKPQYINIEENILNRVQCYDCLNNQCHILLEPALNNYRKILVDARKKYNFDELEFNLIQSQKYYQIIKDSLKEFTNQIDLALKASKNQILKIKQENYKMGRDYTEKKYLQLFAKENYEILRQLQSENINSDQLQNLLTEQSIKEIYNNFRQEHYKTFYEVIKDTRSQRLQINTIFSKLEDQIHHQQIQTQLTSALIGQIPYKAKYEKIIFDNENKNFLHVDYNKIILYSLEESKFKKQQEQLEDPFEIQTVCLKNSLQWFALATKDELKFFKFLEPKKEQFVENIQQPKIVNLDFSQKIPGITTLKPDEYRNRCYSMNATQIQIWQCMKGINYQANQWSLQKQINAQIQCTSYSLSLSRAYLWLFVDKKSINVFDITNTFSTEELQPKELEVKFDQQYSQYEQAYFLEITNCNPDIQKFLIVTEKSILLIECNINKQTANWLKIFKISSSFLTFNNEGNYLVQMVEKKKIIIYKLQRNNGKFKLKKQAQILYQKPVEDFINSQNYLTISVENNFEIYDINKIPYLPPSKVHDLTAEIKHDN